MAGKNHNERSFRLIFDDSGASTRDLSGDLVPGSVSGGGFVYDEADMTGVSESVRNFLAGHADAEVSARFHMNDTATTGATTVLNGQNGSTGTLTLQWGQSSAAPASGDPEWEGEYVLIQNNIVLDGNKFVHDCVFMPTGSTAPAWGTVA